MPDVVILADTLRSPEMRRELPRLRTIDGIEARALEELGIEELTARGVSYQDALHGEVVVRACERAGVREAITPRSFPLQAAEALAAAGVTLRADGAAFDRRRRAKTPVQVEGIRRAQRACERAMDAVRATLRETPEVTSEHLHAAVAHAFVDAGVVPVEGIASHGAQAAAPHDEGSGRILPGEPIIVDIFPIDPKTGCYSDMTRTFCVGDAPEELRHYHALCREALARATAAIGPGVPGSTVFGAAAEVFEDAGLPTLRTKGSTEVLEHGFVHGLGHGVGLDVHELPYLSRGDEPLLPGDVVTLEPGAYRPGFGGCRLEDIVLITEDGAEVLTEYPYELEP